MKGVVSWACLEAKESKYILSRKGIRCDLCKSLGKHGLLLRATVAYNCLDDLTLLYILKRAIGIPHTEAKEQTIRAGLVWAFLRARDQLADSDASFFSRTLSHSILKSAKIKKGSNLISFKIQNRFNSFEEWLNSNSQPFKVMFASGSSKAHRKLMGNVGRNIGELTAVRDAILDVEQDRKSGNFNPFCQFDHKMPGIKIREVIRKLSRNLAYCAKILPQNNPYGKTAKKLLQSTSNVALTVPLITQGSSTCGDSSTSSSPCDQPCCTLCILGLVCICVIAIADEWSKHQEKKQQEEKTRQLETKVAELERQLRAKSLPTPSPRTYVADIRCDRCGFSNPPENEYCGRCGAPLEKEHTRIY